MMVILPSRVRFNLKGEAVSIEQKECRLSVNQIDAVCGLLLENIGNKDKEALCRDSTLNKKEKPAQKGGFA